MEAVLFKVYCYSVFGLRYEVEDRSTGEGVAWSPSRDTVVKKAQKLGYMLPDCDQPVIKFYRAKAS